MAQDGPQGHQGAYAPLSTITNAPDSPCESTSVLSPVVPAVSVDAGNGKVDVVPGPGEGGGSAIGGSGPGTDLSEGKKDSAPDVVVAAGVTEGDVTKGKGKAAAGKKAQSSHYLIERERRSKMKKLYNELRAILPNANEKTDKTTMVTETIGFIKQLEGTLEALEKKKRERMLAQQAAASAAAAAADPGAGSSSAAPPAPAAAQVTTLSPVLPQGWGWLPKQKKKEEEEAGAVDAVAPPRYGFHTWSESNVVLNVTSDHAYVAVCVPRRPGVLTMVLSVMEKHHIDVITVQIAGDENRHLFTLYTRVNVDEIKQLDAEAPESRDIYQLAVTEIIVWLSS